MDLATGAALAGSFALGATWARRELDRQVQEAALAAASCPHDPREPMENGARHGWRVRRAGVGRVTATCLGCGRTWEYERDGVCLGELAPERLPVGWRDWWE